jgi:DNA-binding NtrC family response regulator
MAKSKRLPMVTAFLEGDFLKMRALGDETPKDDPLFKYYHALIQRNNWSTSYPEKAEFIRLALTEPPKDIELFIVLLFSFVLLSAQSDRMEDARRTLELMKQLDRETLKPDIKVKILQAERKIHRTLDHYHDELDCLSRTLALLQPGERMWALIKTDRIRSAIENEDFNLAESELKELHPYTRLIVNSWSGSYELLNAFYLYSCGKHQEAWMVLQSYQAGERNLILRERFFLQILCLIQLDRLSEVEDLLDKARHQIQDERPPSLYTEYQLFRWDYEYLRAHQAIAHKKLELARQYAKNGVAAVGSHNLRLGREGLLLQVWVDLSMGHSHAARLILNQLDPEESKPRFATEWARLHLLEKNYSRAAACFKKVSQIGIPEFVQYKLKYAYELSPSQTTILFTAQIDKEDTHITVKSEISSLTDKELKERFIVYSGRSKTVLNFLKQIEKAAPLQSAVLLQNEEGTFPGQVARLLHMKSPHSDRLFIPIGCGATSDILHESEIFGHVKGAFPGASRDRMGCLELVKKGTVFLKNIHLLSFPLQAKLLHALEHYEIKPVGSSKFIPIQARIIASTTESLDRIFRKDLYHLLSRVQIQIPPLRERIEDIPIMTYLFLKKFYGKTDFIVTDELMDALKQYSWPRNVQELEEDLREITRAAGNSPILTPLMFKPGARVQNLLSAPPIPPKFTEELSPPDADDNQGLNYSQGRQKKLKDLFNRKSRLTRAEVARLLGCSLNTAANDLKTLEDSGFILRVNPSSSPRTSFFILASK